MGTACPRDSCSVRNSRGARQLIESAEVASPDDRGAVSIWLKGRASVRPALDDFGRAVVIFLGSFEFRVD